MWQDLRNVGAMCVLAFAAPALLSGCSGHHDEPEAHGTARSALSSPGLTAGYPFSEGTGTTTADASTNAIVGTLTNGPTWGSGKYGSGIVFDGVNDFVSLGNPTALRITGSMTVSAWINSTSFPGDDAAVVSKRNGGSQGFQLDTTIDEGPRGIGFKLTNASGGNMLRYGHTAMQTGTWYHIAGVYDAAALSMHVYLNGVLDDGVQVGTVTSTQQNSSQNVVIGTRPGSSGFAFNGVIDDVRIYSRALSVSEIQSDMANSSGAPADTTPPQVSVQSPAANAVLAGTVSVTAAATDNVSVSGVQFLLDGANLGAEVTSSPYTVSWNTTTASTGAHTLSARARDAAGNTATSAAVAVTVSNPPLLFINQPASGATVSGTSVSIVYSETGDLTNVAHAQFQLDGGAVQQDPSFDGSFQLTGVAAGSHTLTGALQRADNTVIAGTTTSVSFTTTVPDTSPPTVAITAPASGSTVSGTISVAATATDNVAVAGVQFLLDGANLGAEASTAPYSVSWNTATASVGPHTLTARARDAAGNTTTSSPVSVTVSTPPSLSITQPTAGSVVVGTTVSIAYAAAGDLTNVAHAQFQLDGGAVVQDPTFDGVFQLTGVAAGAHTLTAALQRADNTVISGTTASVSFSSSIPDTTPPAVTITAPVAAATVSGSVSVAATATDNVGVVGVQFLVDGTNLGTEATSAPYSVSWNTAVSGNGPHVLSARARDAAGNTTTSTAVSVTVSNSQPAGLLAGYAFDEGSGTVAADVTANNILGTLVNGPTWGAGKYGQAVVLDGVNDFVNLGNPTPLRLTGSMTVSAWINSTTFPADDAAVVSKRAAGSLGFQLDTTIDEGPRTIGFKLTNSAGGAMYRYGSTAMQAGTWYHIAGVYDAAALGLHVYLNGQLNDGVLVGSVTSTQKDSTENVNIGKRPGLASFEFRGAVDDVRIYGRALTAAEITTDMNTSLGTPPDTVAPLVSVTSPSGGATVAGSVTVTASASDNVGVAGVQFLLDGAALGTEDTSAPYSVVWNAAATANGAHSLSARARDSAGNVTVSASVPVTVFNPPILVITTPAQGASLVASTLNIAYSTTGDLAQVAKVNFQLDGGPVQTDTTLDGVFQIASLPAGSHTLTGALARADGSNIVGSEATRTFTSSLPDTTPPSVAITAPTAGSVVAGSVAISANATDDVAVVGVQFLVDGVALGAEDTTAPYTAAWSTTSIANGAHTLTARARDAAGNTSLSAGVTVSVFNPPTLAITQPVQGASLVASTLAIAYTASGDLSQVAQVNFQLDGGPVQTDTTLDGVFQIANLPAGSHTLTGALARADGSNIVGSEATRTFSSSLPDVTAPTVAVTAPAAGATVAGSVTVTAAASDNVGVVGVQFLLDGSALGAEDTSAPYSVVWSTAAAANGTHVLSARARDAAGNATVSGGVSVTLFNPPILTITQPAQGSTFVASTLSISYTTSGDLAQVAKVNFQLDGGPVLTDTTVDGAFQIASIAAGSHTLTGALARADGSNIVGSEATRSFTTTAPDVTAPTISITAPASGATVSGTITVTATASDNVAVTGVQFLVDGANLGTELTAAPYSVSWNTGGVPNGPHTITARARDAAGNSTTTPGLAVNVSNAQTAGLLAGYAFDQGSGTTTNDASPNGITGLVLNGATFATGRYGQAAQFDGADDFVDLGDPAQLRFTGSMTLSAWINPSAFPIDDAAIISKRDGASTGFQLDTTIDTGPRTIGFKLTSTTGTGACYRYGATALQLNAWHHIAGVYNATARTVDVYLDGVLDNGQLVGSVTASQVNSGQHVNIGRRPGSNGFQFQGRIDEVRMYGRALSLAEIQADMSSGLGNGLPVDTTPPLVFIDSPASGSQVSDIVLVTADADDENGVAAVQFMVDGVPTEAEDTTAPYGVAWDTRSLPNGPHVLTAVARDIAGNVQTSAPVTVTIANANFFQNEVLATGFALPTAMKFMPDGRLLVAELAGTIRVLSPPYAQVSPTPFLQLTNVGTAGVQQGIYELTLDPQFATNHYYYIYYTAGTPNRDRLSRFTANTDFTGTVAGSEVVFYQDPANANAEHHGGAINIANDGMIYFTTGENFDSPAAQQLSNPRGKLHRINRDGTTPTDNPFYDGNGPNWDSIWALGLRNPYRAYYDSPTDRLLIADVGGNDYYTAQEEVDVGARGANYGWPNCELGTCGNPAYTPAIYAYPHLGRDASITGGFVYHGSEFPSSYQGSYFFADYTQNWIRRLTFDASGQVNGVFNFEPADGSLDGPYGDIVYLTEGPEGSLYYLDLGYSDIGATFGISKLRRIRYISSNQPPIAVAAADQISGPTPLSVTFSSAGSSDPEGLGLTYLWDFGDGATSTLAAPTHVYANAGTYTVRLSVSDGTNSTFALPLIIKAGSAPTATILTPTDGIFFVGGQTISYSGDGVDPDDGPLPASAFTWNIDFLHAGHVHPGVPVTGVKSGTFTIPTSGHDFSGNTRYRVTLTVTDSSGLSTSTSAIVWPDKVNIAFDTVPSGQTLYLDGIATQTPFVHDTLKNFVHTIEARNASANGSNYTFASWSDGGAQTHDITVPNQDTSLTATYTVTTPTLPSGLVAAWSFTEGTGVVTADASGGSSIMNLLSGATWATGRYGSGISLLNNAYLDTPDSGALDLASSYTLSAWVNPSSALDFRTILIKENATGGGGCGYWLQLSDTGITSGFNDGGGCIEHAANVSVPLGSWSHIAAVFNDSANTYSLYLNGSLLASQPEARTPAPNDRRLTIGNSSFGEAWAGLLDEVRIYGRALSAAEVVTDMNNAL